MLPLPPWTTIRIAMRVQPLYQKVFEIMELEEYKDNFEPQIETFIKSTNVTNPVQKAVNISIDSVQIKVKFKSYLYMHPIRKLIGSSLLENVTEYTQVLLS